MLVVKCCSLGTVVVVVVVVVVVDVLLGLGFVYNTIISGK